MRFKIAVCDDDPSAVTVLSDMVRFWAEKEGHHVQIAAFPSAEAFLFAYEDDNTFNILLLDVEMREMDGITLAKRLRREGCHAEIIFVTSHFKICAKGYEVDALHYLMKPVRQEELFTVLGRAAQKLSRKLPSVIISCDGQTLRIPEDEILYVEALLHYIVIHTEKESYRVKEGLSVFEKRVSAALYRSHRSCLVSLKRIVRLSRSSVWLEDGTELPLSRGKYDDINRAFIAAH